MGLVDELVDNVDALERRAVEVLESATRKKSARVMAARHATKLLGREAFVARWWTYLDGEAALGWEALAAEGAVEMLRGVVARLGLKGPKSNL